MSTKLQSVTLKISKKKLEFADLITSKGDFPEVEIAAFFHKKRICSNKSRKYWLGAQGIRVWNKGQNHLYSTRLMKFHFQVHRILANFSFSTANKWCVGHCTIFYLCVSFSFPAGVPPCCEITDEVIIPRINL